jgi:hypothetical protein
VIARTTIRPARAVAMHVEDSCGPSTSTLTPSPVTWVQGLESLTPEEKEKILWRNLETLLQLPAAAR